MPITTQRPPGATVPPFNPRRTTTKRQERAALRPPTDLGQTSDLYREGLGIQKMAITWTDLLLHAG